jgi:hypothetical protein
MFDYLLTIRIPFKCEDDVDARKKAQALMADSKGAFKEEISGYKLQRLNTGKPPEKVEI